MKQSFIVGIIAIFIFLIIGCMEFEKNVILASENDNNNIIGTRNGKNWSKPIEIAKYDYTYIPSPVSIIVDKLGDWHIVYSDRVLFENNSQRYFIKYKNSNSTEILAEAYGNIFDDTGDGLGFPSIAMDKDGGLHVTYTYWLNKNYINQSVMYIRKDADSSSWSVAKEIAKFDYIWIPSRSSIVIDSNGEWHIVYSDRDRFEDNSDKRYIKYKNKSSIETLAEGYGNIFTKTGEGVGHPSIAIDSDDNIHVSYIYLDYDDVSVQSIMYITKNVKNLSWSSAKKISTFDYSFKPSYTSIAMDTEGDWHIVYPDLVSYKNNSDRRYIKYKNQGNTEVIAEGFGNTFDESGEGVGYPSIAIGPKQDLHVIYTHMNYIDTSNQSIMYTTRNAIDKSSDKNDSENDKDSGFLPSFELIMILMCVLLITMKYNFKRIEQ